MAARRWLVAAVLIGAVALTGCAAQTPAASDDIPHDASSGGQTMAEAAATIEAIPGLTLGEPLKSVPPNVKGNTGRTFVLQLEPGYEIADGPALIDFLMATAWSIREGYLPNATVDIRLTSPAGSTFDLETAAVEAGWREDRGLGRESEFSSTPISVAESKEQGAKNIERLGSWPGDAPAAPTGITGKL